ncbi:MAG: DNA polymerase III subunit delta, partial [Spirochaetota bacterium]
AVPPQARKVFWELFENQKRGWVVSHFRKRKVQITPEALDLFLDLVENNTQELRTEADKLCVYEQMRQRSEQAATRDGQPVVGIDEVETFIYHSREENVFTLYKAVVEDDFAAALEIVEKLSSSGEGGPVQLVGGLVFQVKKLVALRSLLDGRFSMDEAFRRLNIRGKRIQADSRAAVSRFDLPELRRQLNVLIDYDAAFRELGSGMQRTLLDLLVYQLMFRSESISVREEVDARLIG